MLTRLLAANYREIGQTSHQNIFQYKRKYTRYTQQCAVHWVFWPGMIEQIRQSEDMKASTSRQLHITRGKNTMMRVPFQKRRELHFYSGDLYCFKSIQCFLLSEKYFCNILRWLDLDGTFVKVWQQRGWVSLIKAAEIELWAVELDLNITPHKEEEFWILFYTERATLGNKRCLVWKE